MNGSDNLLRFLPRVCFCTDDLKNGLIRRRREKAVNYRYLELNRPGYFDYLVFDIDHAGARFAAYDANLPEPTFTVENPANTHAHIIYRLSAPVHRDGRSKPILYLNAIKRAYTELLQADRNYAGLIAKNPVNPYWRTIENSNLAYDLSELADYVELPRIETKETEVIMNPKGRNCSLFDTLRHWSYKAIRKYWRPGQPGYYPDWFADVLAKARDMNAFEGKEPLGGREITAIAKSVAAWTWRHMTPAAQDELIQRTHTAELQAARVQKRWQTEAAKAEALRILAAGANVANVAQNCGVSEQTIKRWSAGAKITGQRNGII